MWLGARGASEADGEIDGSRFSGFREPVFSEQHLWWAECKLQIRKEIASLEKVSHGEKIKHLLSKVGANDQKTA